jgi:hypothetical protein
MKKDKAIAVFNEMPAEFDIEVLIERLIFVEKVEAGLKQVEQEKVKSHQTVKEISEKWSS